MRPLKGVPRNHTRGPWLEDRFPRSGGVMTITCQPRVDLGAGTCVQILDPGGSAWV